MHYRDKIAALTPSAEQEACVHALQTTPNHMAISAAAGSAKTTTLMMLAAAAEQAAQPFVIVAFNASVRAELNAAGFSKNVAHTFSSLAYATYRAATGTSLPVGGIGAHPSRKAKQPFV